MIKNQILKSTILLLVLVVSPSSFSQRNQKIRVISSKKEIGRNLIKQKPIHASEYILPDRIQDFQIDTVQSYLTLQLRGLSKNGKWLANKGYVVRYDPVLIEVKWSKKVAYQSESIEQYGGITIHSAAGKSYSLDNETANRLWEVKNSLVFADTDNKIGIGYKIQANKNSGNTLEGIDLKSGNVIWQREITREYSWNDVFYINDSTLLIAAAGIHTLNIKDGTGWDYHIITGKKDYTTSAVGTGLGVVAGLLTGTYSVTTGHDLVRDIASNVIVDSANIYFASRENIVKLDKKGKIIWQTQLPDDLASKSVILKNGGKLIMINKGYAYMGYRQLDFGTPFIASFDLKTGEKMFLTALSTEKKEFIRDYSITDENIFFVYPDRISKYSMENGSEILNKKYNSVEYGELRYFVGDQVFVKQDSIYKSLLNSDSTKHYLFTKSGKTLILDGELVIQDEINFEELYLYYLRKNDLTFIAQENQTFVINGNGEAIAELSVTNQSMILNNKLFNAQGSSFLEIDLNELLEK